MTKHLKKQLLRLKARRADHKPTKTDSSTGGFRSPGSMNSHKSYSIKGRKDK